MDRAREFCQQLGTWVCQHIRNLCRAFWKFWCVTLKRLCLKEEEDDYLPASECIFHKEKIAKLGHVLRNESETVYERAQAAYKIGLLAFTGGPNAAKFATQYMREIPVLLQSDQALPKTKILLLQSISYWCYLNPTSQRKAYSLQFLPVLTAIFHSDIEFASRHEKNKHLLVKFWTCYVLSVLTCNNMLWVKELSACKFLKYNLQALAIEDWSGWPENFAEVLYFLIGFHRI